MGQYITALLTTSLLMSAVILALILFNKLFSGKYPAKWRYYIWLIVIIGLLVPFRPNLGLPTQIPVDSIMQSNTNDTVIYNHSEQVQNEQNNTDAQLGLADNQIAEDIQPQKTMWPITSILFVVWLAGALFSLVFHLWRHKRFTGAVRRWSEDVEDEQSLTVLQQVKADLGLDKKQIQLKTCKSITSPMLIDFIKPTILLPEKPIHEDELPMILKHELIHYKRKDLWVKAFILFATVIHWFNPIVYWMVNVIQADCESSCEEALLGDTDTEIRRVYGEAIIGVIDTKNAKRTALSTYFYGGKNTMKKRLFSIMNTGKKRIGIAVLCGVLVLTATVMTGAALASNNTLAATPSEITVEQAKETALATVGGGTVTKCEIDNENGRKVYEIEIIYGDNKYEMDVDAISSAVTDYKVEAITQNNNPTSSSDNSADAQSQSGTSSPAATSEITAEKAKEVALAKVGGGTVTKCEIDYENGRKVYDITIVYGNNKYEMDVDAITGAITDYKVETNDHDDDHDDD